MTQLRSKVSNLWQLEQLITKAWHRSRSNILEHMKLYENRAILPPYLGLRRSAPTIAFDYQTSLALILGNKTSEVPETIANDILQALQEIQATESEANTPLMISNAKVSDKGFLNFQLSNKYIGHQVVKTATDGINPFNQEEIECKRILVDFAGPNCGKKLHVGHLRSSVLGDTISNLLEFQGHQVTRVSHVGNVGVAIAVLLTQLLHIRGSKKQFYPNKWTIEELQTAYQQGKRNWSISREFKAKVDEIVMILQRMDDKNATSSAFTSEVLDLWKDVCDISRHSVDTLLSRLNVNVMERGEATYLKLIPSMLKELQENGHVEMSQGALCMFLKSNKTLKKGGNENEDDPPLILQKQDGSYLYATIDLAAIYSRIFGFPGIDSTRYDEIIYVTDASQKFHFQQLFGAVKQVNWIESGSDSPKLIHAAFGMVLSSNGTKLSSRDGVIEYLDDLLNEAAIECQRRSVLGQEEYQSPEAYKAQNAKLGAAAIRYFELTQQRERNYTINFDQILHLKGNTGIYLLYATARLQGVLRTLQHMDGYKGIASWGHFFETMELKQRAIELLTVDTIVHNHESIKFQWHESERSLALLLTQFPDDVALSTKLLAPHLLCEYLYRLVGQFHIFYENCRILNHERMESRLILCAATNLILEKGLRLLGVEPVDRM